MAAVGCRALRDYQDSGNPDLDDAELALGDLNQIVDGRDLGGS